VPPARFLAFDLGAESGRAVVASLAGGHLAIEPAARFANTPLQIGESLRWNIDDLWAHMRAALEGVDAPLASIGVDTWGCDYALLDSAGQLLEPPYHYRDGRTAGVMTRVVDRLGRDRIYETTGIQFLPFNSLYQLAAARQAESQALSKAAAFVTIADLFGARLSGRVACEYTNATTTQCVDASKRTWAWPLIEALDLPSRIFGEVVEPGTVLGCTRAELGRHRGVPVVAPACHDTGSAVAAVATGGDTAFLSSGTWSLLGVELPGPVLTPRAASLNFTNEGGVGGTIRLLKNISGLWLLQASRRDWAHHGQTFTYSELTDAAADAPARTAFVDPDDPSFLNPPDMPSAIAAYCERTGQKSPATPAHVARTIFESLALKYRFVLEGLEEVSGLAFRTLRIVGGGAQNRLLNQLIADVTARSVVAGPIEATALGNVAVQMLATGYVSSIAAARAVIDGSFPADRFVPRNTEAWERHYRRFRDCVELTRV
jgi:rhamnulokinase